MTRVNKDMIISDIIQIDINLIRILMSEGMHCIGCPASQGESLEMACAVHGIDADDMVKVLNDYLESKEAGEVE